MIPLRAIINFILVVWIVETVGVVILSNYAARYKKQLETLSDSCMVDHNTRIRKLIIYDTTITAASYSMEHENLTPSDIKEIYGIELTIKIKSND